MIEEESNSSFSLDLPAGEVRGRSFTDSSESVSSYCLVGQNEDKVMEPKDANSMSSKDERIKQLEMDLHYALYDAEKARGALGDLHEGVRILTRQMKRSNACVDISEEGNDKKKTSAEPDSIQPEQVSEVPTSNDGKSRKDFLSGLEYGEAWQKQVAACGSPLSARAESSPVRNRTWSGMSVSSVKSYVSDDDMRLSDLTGNMDGQEGASLMGLSHACKMVTENAQFASEEAAQLVEDALISQVTTGQATEKALKAARAVKHLYKENRKLTKELEQARTERRILFKEVKKLLQLRAQDDLQELEANVMNAVLAHERQLNTAELKQASVPIPEESNDVDEHETAKSQLESDRVLPIAEKYSSDLDLTSTEDSENSMDTTTDLKCIIQKSSSQTPVSSSDSVSLPDLVEEIEAKETMEEKDNDKSSSILLNKGDTDHSIQNKKAKRAESESTPDSPIKATVTKKSTSAGFSDMFSTSFGKFPSLTTPSAPKTKSKPNPSTSTTSRGTINFGTSKSFQTPKMFKVPSMKSTTKVKKNNVETSKVIATETKEKCNELSATTESKRPTCISETDLKVSEDATKNSDKNSEEKYKPLHFEPSMNSPHVATKDDEKGDSTSSSFKDFFHNSTNARSKRMHGLLQLLDPLQNEINHQQESQIHNSDSGGESNFQKKIPQQVKDEKLSSVPKSVVQDD
eukprot:scaffold291813_cov55-Attheya_sp.AAC.2